MVRLAEESPMCLSYEEVAMRTGCAVLMEVDDNILLIGGDVHGILEEQLRLHPIHLMNSIVLLKIILNNKFLVY